MPTSIVISCPSCGAGNRIPSDKEGRRGHCGSCHALLPPIYHTPQQLSTATFDAFIANFPGPVLAEFWAPWCPHCRSFAPMVRTVAEKLAGKAAVIQINTQDNPALASRFAVQGIPLIVLFRNGRSIAQLSGARSVDELLVWFRQHI